MQEEKNIIKLPHNIIMEDRKKLSVSGVTEIESFDESIVVMATQIGDLTVKGTDLHINKLNVDTGELTVEGSIYSMSYSQEQPRNTSIIKRIFK